MTIYESVGYVVVIGSSALGMIVCGWAAYQHLRRMLDMAKRGIVEEMRDVRRAEHIRQEVGSGF